MMRRSYCGKPNIYASIFQFEGQVSRIQLSQQGGCTGTNYRDLYPTPPPPGLVPSCAEGGVLGVLPGIIGSLQALESDQGDHRRGRAAGWPFLYF